MFFRELFEIDPDPSSSTVSIEKVLSSFLFFNWKQVSLSVINNLLSESFKKYKSSSSVELWFKGKKMRPLWIQAP